MVSIVRFAGEREERERFFRDVSVYGRLARLFYEVPGLLPGRVMIVHWQKERGLNSVVSDDEVCLCSFFAGLYEEFLMCSDGQGLIFEEALGCVRGVYECSRVVLGDVDLFNVVQVLFHWVFTYEDCEGGAGELCGCMRERLVFLRSGLLPGVLDCVLVQCVPSYANASWRVLSGVSVL